MTPDPIPAIVDQLAAVGEQLSRLDAREAGHHATLTGLLAGLTARLTPAKAGDGPGGYQPGPAPAWWQLAPDARQEPLARLRGWVERVYRPGYGHLAAALAPCWHAHDLCLYGLDILAELWSVLYLQPQRTAALLSAQAEYQARVLPAMADQFRRETSGCGHPRGPVPGAGHSWSSS